SFQSSGSQGFAIPINTALRIEKAIVAGRSSDTIHIGATALIGVEISNRPAVQCVSGFATRQPQAAYVQGVVAGGPAAAAGTGIGDTIPSLGGRTVHSPTGLVAAKDRYHPGDRVRIKWIGLNGARHSATVRLSTGPAD